MDKPIETIEIDATNRYALYYDEYSYDFLSEWEWQDLGVATLRIDRYLKPLELELDDHNDRIREIMEHARQLDEIYPAIYKHFDRAGYHYEFVNLQGYSQGEWAEVVVFANPESWPSGIDGFIEELKAWWRGDYYHVAWEQLVTYKADNGASIERWEIVESVCQTIFTDSYKFTAENCAELLGAVQIVQVA